MGNFFSKTHERGDFHIGGNLKLDSQKVTEFLGRMEDWQRWKSRTTCAFDGSGYERILTDPVYAVLNPRANKIVYSQLSVATVSGTAHHLVKQFETSKNGNMAWEALLEWFDGDAIRNETADALRDKLSHLKLNVSTSAASYINNFLTWYRDLCKIPGEGISDSHAISMFLSNITDPAYATFVQIQKANMCDLKTAVIAIRKHERDILVNKSNGRRFGNYRHQNNVRRRRDYDDYEHYGPSRDDHYHDDSQYDERYEPRMSSSKRRRVGGDNKLVEVTPTSAGMLHFPADIWKNRFGPEERDFISNYNGQIRNHEKPSIRGCPWMIKVIWNDRPSTSYQNDRSTQRRDDSHSGRDDDQIETREPKDGKRESALRRKISFNLNESKGGNQD